MLGTTWSPLGRSMHGSVSTEVRLDEALMAAMADLEPSLSGGTKAYDSR